MHENLTFFVGFFVFVELFCYFCVKLNLIMKIQLSNQLIRNGLKLLTIGFLIATIYVQNLHIRRLEKKCELIEINQKFGD